MCGTRNSSLLVKITILVVICCFVLSAEGKYGGGSGEPNDPYLIYTAAQMNAIGANAADWDKCFKLTADIDMRQFGGDEYNVIGEIHYDSGWIRNPFTGVYDGNGHTISNFTYNSAEKNVGLFGYFDGEIKNLGIINPNVRSEEHIGSLVGKARGGTISGCYVQGGSVSGAWQAGRLMGVNEGLVVDCYSIGNASGQYDVGGLIGNNRGTVVNCYAIGNVSGAMFLGGLVGTNSYEGTLTKCYSHGSVSGTASLMGGLAGNNDGNIVNCYSTSTVEGGSGYNGGLVGDNLGKITKCYSVGFVTSVGIHIGGLVGNDVACDWYCWYGETVDSVWDTETSGQASSAGGEGKSTAEMHQQSTFQDWDFINVWNIGENQTYPYLRTYLAGDINKDGIVNFKDLGFLALHWLENYGAEKPPQVQITYPEDGARLMVGGVPPQTMIMAEANDYDGIVVRVEFFANDLKLGEDPDGSDGWNYLWQEYSLGWHVLTATAWDEEGLSGTSSPVNVEVWMPDPPPP